MPALAWRRDLGFAFLAKGPIGWIPLLTVASTKLFLRDQPLNPRFRFASGMLCTIAIILAWGVPPTRTAQELYPTIPQDWKSYTARGLLPPRAKRPDLTLILKP
jgi:hypothetical protein